MENEWLCAQIIEALGLPMARTEMATFDDRRALIVERFDREWMDGGQWIARLPQEDFCQALGQPPHLKYEEDGGPYPVQGLQLLSASTDASSDRIVFLLVQLVFWLMAAPDGARQEFLDLPAPRQRLRHDTTLRCPVHLALRGQRSRTDSSAGCSPGYGNPFEKHSLPLAYDPDTPLVRPGHEKRRPRGLACDATVGRRP